MILQKVADKLYIVRYAGETRYFNTEAEAENYRLQLEEKFLQLV